jgi:dTMP kinase
MSKGAFISFEGIDGCGKTTQTKLLADYFAENGVAHLLTREPGGEESAEKLRQLILESESGAWEMESELLLFLASRIQHVRRTINPALQSGANVICDRFIDSTYIYQSGSSSLYDKLHRLMLGNFKPDLTFLLDIDAQTGLQRAKCRNDKPDYFEAKGLEFYQQLRTGFLQLAKAEPQRIIVLDATLSPQTLHHQIIAHINLWQN